MVQTVKDGRVEVYLSESNSDTPDFTIDAERVESFDVSQRLQRRKDTGSIRLNNDDGFFSDDEHQITSGDRLDMFVAPEGSPIGYGEGGYGWGGYGGAKYFWSALVGSPSYVRGSETESYLDLDGVDFTYGILASRVLYNNFEQVQVAGTESSIVNTVIRQDAPEIDRSRIETFAEKTDMFSDGGNLLDKIVDMAKRVDAVLYGSRDRLAFVNKSNIGLTFKVDPEDDIGTFSHKFDSKSITNSIRIDGGTSHAIDDEQLTQDGYTTVSDSTQLQFQVSTRKSEIDRIEIWTNRTGSNESFNVRIQKDDGGAPVEPGNTDSDIANKQLSYEFTDDDGFTTFIMPSHTLPEPNPWIIVETDGSSGQNIGVRTSDGVPTYKAHYPYPIAIEMSNPKSAKQYRRREERVKRKNIATREAAIDIGNRVLDHESTPESKFAAPALSRRAHDLTTGSIIEMDLPRERCVGDYIITERQDTYSAETNLIKTTLTAQEVSSL